VVGAPVCTLIWLAPRSQLAADAAESGRLARHGREGAGSSWKRNSRRKRVPGRSPGVPPVACSPGTLPGGSVETAPLFWVLVTAGAASTPGGRSSAGQLARDSILDVVVGLIESGFRRSCCRRRNVFGSRDIHQ
jgi:hypothetical protein